MNSSNAYSYAPSSWRGSYAGLVFILLLASGGTVQAEGSNVKTGAPSVKPASATTPPSNSEVQIPATEVRCKDGIDNDRDGKLDCDDWDCQSPGGDCVAAPQLDRTVASTMREMTRFLYTGNNPLQKGMRAGAVSGDLGIVGKAVDLKDKPISGVRVSIQGRPELGYTYTRANGSFDMVVSGASVLNVQFDLDGYIQVTRTVSLQSNMWSFVPTAGLVERNVGLTTNILGASTECQSAKGNSVGEGVGRVEPLVVFEPGTLAHVELPNAPSTSLAKLTTTITQFPITSDNRFVSMAITGREGIVIACNLDVAEARRLGTDRVEVSKPISLYFQDTYGQQVGVKLGVAGNLGQGKTVTRGLPSGIIRIIGHANGTARVDTDGNGRADSTKTLEALGITECDLKQLAKTYKPGTRLNFSKLSHL